MTWKTKEYQDIEQEIVRMRKMFRRWLAILLTIFAIAFSIWIYLFYKAMNQRPVCKPAREIRKEQEADTVERHRFYLQEDEDGNVIWNYHRFN